MRAGEVLEVRENAEKAGRQLKKQSNSPQIEFGGCYSAAEYFRTTAFEPEYEYSAKIQSPINTLLAASSFCQKRIQNIVGLLKKYNK